MMNNCVSSGRWLPSRCGTEDDVSAVEHKHPGYCVSSKR